MQCHHKSDPSPPSLLLYGVDAVLVAVGKKMLVEDGIGLKYAWDSF